MKILAAYDGTLYAKKVLGYGISKIRDHGGEVVVVSIFDRNLFIDYEAGPNAETMARAEFANHLEEGKSILSAAGVSFRIITEEGDAKSRIVHYVEEEQPDIVLVPQRFKSLKNKCSKPVFVVPGRILVPLDHTGFLNEQAGRIAKEATATGSKIILLGLVSVHLYGSDEKKEIDFLRRETETSIQKMQSALRAESVETMLLVRDGYPDEEILKVASEEDVSLVVFPTGSIAPSELSKAAAILTAEPEKLCWPVLFIPELSV